MANTGISNKAVFLQGNDALADAINNKANELFCLLQNFDAPALNITADYRDYFIHHHLGKRLFFSLQNSAHIIFDSVKKSGKPVSEIQFIDYGAGLGTLFMLAGMMGFKKTVYNDYLPDWQQTAQSICETLKIKIDAYVTGDIDAVMQHAKNNGIQYDIIASRNVIEHIYNLPQFYTAVFRHNPGAVTYSTTTANYHNPVMNWYHIYIHQQTEKKYYRQQRREEIKKLQPLLPDDKLNRLIALTRGKGQQDFTDAVNNFANNTAITKDSSLRSNTCDCINGVWIEHLLTKKEHGNIIEAAGFKMQYTAGYWDTHYSSGLKNTMAGIFNKIIALLGKENGIVLSPFVNVVAYN
jgi:2-polyprenyl-3-methyl-5-hydroxy-6-metoxy-1,4-benzoquinol methylase